MKRLLASLYIKIAGWEMEGVPPKSPKSVIIAAPHTSNWDLAYLLAFAILFNVKISWIGKHSLFHWPMGWFMRLLGGVPVRRHLRENMVQQMARLFEERERFSLIVPTEGTRGHAPFWKSGFYHIARTANVPLVMGFLDYKRKRGGFGEEFWPTGDVKADMDRIRAFYADKTGKYPQNFGPIRLRDEIEASREGESPDPATPDQGGVASAPSAPKEG